LVLSRIPAARFLTKAILVASLLWLCATSTIGAAAGRSESALLTALNRARARHGLKPLVVDPKLAEVARAHSIWMLHAGLLSHSDFSRRVPHCGAHGPTFAENLAWGTGSRAQATAIVSAWLSSPEHRANLLRPGFRRVGLGDVRGRFAGISGARVVTVDFAGR
jgi:uncharacterized protein YkwD